MWVRPVGHKEKEMQIDIEEVNKVANRTIRKYDWSTEKIQQGVRLTITDGQHDASVDITTGEDIEGEMNRLIEAVDKQDYTVIG